MVRDVESSCFFMYFCGQGYKTFLNANGLKSYFMSENCDKGNCPQPETNWEWSVKCYEVYGS